jgi:hypothetical protein
VHGLLEIHYNTLAVFIGVTEAILRSDVALFRRLSVPRRRRNVVFLDTVA